MRCFINVVILFWISLIYSAQSSLLTPIFASTSKRISILSQKCSETEKGTCFQPKTSSSKTKNSIPRGKPRNPLHSAIAGAISCSFTHSLVVPLDVIKTKIQTDSSLSKLSLGQAFKAVLSRGGGNKNVLLQGLAATSTGYFVQGFFKFGGYEYFKAQIGNRFVNAPKIPILIASSCLAEVIASVYMCPLEATRIFMILNTDVAKKGMLHSMKTIMNKEGPRGFFKGLNFILLRQIPYTCVKLAGYDCILETLRRGVRGLRSKIDNADWKDSMSPGLRGKVDQKLANLDDSAALQIVTGVIAGVAAAAASHPADVLLSRVCGGVTNAFAKNCILIQNVGDAFQLVKDIGFKNLYAGLEPRAIMLGSMTALQFFVYENARSKIADMFDKCHHKESVSDCKKYGKSNKNTKKKNDNSKKVEIQASKV